MRFLLHCTHTGTRSALGSCIHCSGNSILNSILRPGNSFAGIQRPLRFQRTRFHQACSRARTRSSLRTRTRSPECRSSLNGMSRPRNTHRGSQDCGMRCLHSCIRIRMCGSLSRRTRIRRCTRSSSSRLLHGNSTARSIARKRLPAVRRAKGRGLHASWKRLKRLGIIMIRVIGWRRNGLLS